MTAAEFSAQENELFLRLRSDAQAALREAGLDTGHLSLLPGLYPDLPYHGLLHGLSTGLRAADEARRIGMDPCSVKSILLAGLYHDARHTGRPGIDDIVNVERAQVAWMKYGFPLDPIPGVDRLIAATRFPHGPLSRADEIVLANADILQTKGSPFWQHALWWETGIEANDRFSEQHLIPYPPTTVPAG